MRRSALRRGLLLLLAILILAFPGCAQTDPDKTGITQSTATSKQQETTQPSLQPSATQPAGETTSSTKQSGATTIEAKLAAAPDIEGAEKTIMAINSLQRVIYLALPDNPYGLASGVMIGEYKHEVFLGDEQTGGLALAAPVVQAYLQSALDAMPSQENRWLLTLPLDLTDCRSLRPVKIDLSAKPFIDRLITSAYLCQTNRWGWSTSSTPSIRWLLTPSMFLACTL